MVKEHTLKSADTKKERRIGRGQGSGRGTFSGRGCKGQKARTGKKLRPGFEGGQTPLMQRMPKLRGFTNPNDILYQIINVNDLEAFKDNAKITRKELAAQKLITYSKGPVKLLADGALQKKVTIEVDAASKIAVSKIEKAGGTVTIIKK